MALHSDLVGTRPLVEVIGVVQHLLPQVDEHIVSPRQKTDINAFLDRVARDEQHLTAGADADLVTEVRVEGCGAELARACFPDQSLSRVQRTGPTASREACGWPMVGRRRAGFG